MAQQVNDRFARHFLERLHAAVNAHDAEAVAALCCEDVVWKDPAAPEPLHGREAVYRFHRDIMFRALSDVRIELVDGPYLSLDGEGAAVRLRISGTMTGPLTPPASPQPGDQSTSRVRSFRISTATCLPAMPSCWTCSGSPVKSVPSRKRAASPSASVSASNTSPLEGREGYGGDTTPHFSLIDPPGGDQPRSGDRFTFARCTPPPGGRTPRR